MNTQPGNTEDVNENDTSVDLSAALERILDGIDRQKADMPEKSVPAVENVRKDNTPSPDIGKTVEGLLSNPELMAKLPQLLSLVKPLLTANRHTGEVPAPDVSDKKPDTDDIPASGKPSSPTVKPHARSCDKRVALLLALKPYLNHERQEVIEYIIKLNKLGDLLSGLF